MKIVNFLTLSLKPPPSTPPVFPSSPTTPPSLQHTPTDHVTVATPSLSTPGSSPIISSPVVIQYMKNLPKRSPVKSPLAKYKRMKQLRPSPLKARQSSSSSSHRIKPVQLHFPSAQGSSPVVNEPTTERKNASAKSKAHGKAAPTKQPHLVTLSKNSLKQSGSFTGLRLDDIFHSVNENLKGVQLKSITDDKASKTGSTNIHVTPLTKETDKQSPTEVAENTKTLTPTHLTSTTQTQDFSSLTLTKASPLEQLASQVSSKQTLQSLKPSTSPYQM